MTYTETFLSDLMETVERVERNPRFNRTCYRCGAIYARHSAVDEFCPTADWYSETDTFLELGPAHDAWVTGDSRC